MDEPNATDQNQTAPLKETAEQKKTVKTLNRASTREPLTRWCPSKDQLLLLGVEYVANMRGISVPWEEAAQFVNPHLTGEAVKQHLVKLRNQRIKEGEIVPPGPSRSRRRASTGVDNTGLTPQKTVAASKPQRKRKVAPSGSSLTDASFTGSSLTGSLLITPSKPAGVRSRVTKSTSRKTPSVRRPRTKKNKDSVIQDGAVDYDPDKASDMDGDYGVQTSARKKRGRKSAARDEDSEADAGETPTKKSKFVARLRRSSIDYGEDSANGSELGSDIEEVKHEDDMREGEGFDEHTPKTDSDMTGEITVGMKREDAEDGQRLTALRRGFQQLRSHPDVSSYVMPAASMYPGLHTDQSMPFDLSGVNLNSVPASSPFTIGNLRRDGAVFQGQRDVGPFGAYAPQGRRPYFTHPALNQSLSAPNFGDYTNEQSAGQDFPLGMQHSVSYNNVNNASHAPPLDGTVYFPFGAPHNESFDSVNAAASSQTSTMPYMGMYGSQDAFSNADYVGGFGNVGLDAVGYGLSDNNQDLGVVQNNGIDFRASMNEHALADNGLNITLTPEEVDDEEQGFGVFSRALYQTHADDDDEVPFNEFTSSEQYTNPENWKDTFFNKKA
ncbi:hypothetical protein B0A49_09958 [Cryomyces minteri]|uniref:Myb-like domain-containing protein n=1 Tax=Cryomyces minteri TaxID=331657 RepID=A0A4U0WPR9_9PEZI|nr:hypothetical protein B0A49_09958 [Cryomyces minteri]